MQFLHVLAAKNDWFGILRPSSSIWSSGQKAKTRILVLNPWGLRESKTNRCDCWRFDPLKLSAWQITCPSHTFAWHLNPWQACQKITGQLGIAIDPKKNLTYHLTKSKNTWTIDFRCGINGFEAVKQTCWLYASNPHSAWHHNVYHRKMFLFLQQFQGDKRESKQSGLAWSGMWWMHPPQLARQRRAWGGQPGKTRQKMTRKYSGFQPRKHLLMIFDVCCYHSGHVS